MQNSADIGILLGEAKKWALEHINSKDAVTGGMAKRFLNLHSAHAVLSSAVAKITQHKIELPDDLSNGSGRFEASLEKLPVDLVRDLNQFRAELKQFIPLVLPGIKTQKGISFTAPPEGTIARLNKLNNRAKQLSQRAIAAPTVLGMLPIGYKSTWQPRKRGPKPKNMPRK